MSFSLGRRLQKKKKYLFQFAFIHLHLYTGAIKSPWLGCLRYSPYVCWSGRYVVKRSYVIIKKVINFFFQSRDSHLFRDQDIAV